MTAFSPIVFIRIFVIAVWLVLTSGCGGPEYPAAIQISARPGAVAVVPFDQPLRGKRQRAMSFIPVRPLVLPSPIPQKARLVYNKIALHGSGNVSGHLLIRVPEEANGDIQFSVSASGEGSRAVGGSASFFSTDNLDVTISVDGAPVETPPPDLAGEWREDDATWTFRTGRAPSLNISRASGEEKTVNYNIYPDGRGRWVLVEPGLQGLAYWIEINQAGTLLVAHLGEDFDPFARFARAGQE